MVIRSTFLFSHWNRKSKTDDPVIVSSLAFTSETKISSDSLCPNLPYSMSRRHGPNTIQQDIHLNIQLAGNSPVGYLAGTILLPIIQKIRHYSQNESYLTQCHTKGFQKSKLVSLYSESVSHENSKRLHFASVQMKHMVQNRPFFLIQNRMKT